MGVELHKRSISISYGKMTYPSTARHASPEYPRHGDFGMHCMHWFHRIANLNIVRPEVYMLVALEKVPDASRSFDTFQTNISDSTPLSGKSSRSLPHLLPSYKLVFSDSHDCCFHRPLPRCTPLSHNTRTNRRSPHHYLPKS